MDTTISEQKTEVFNFLTCACCLELMHQPQMLSCGHPFCSACWSACNQNRCPTCRAPYPTEEDGLSQTLHEIATVFTNTGTYDADTWATFKHAVYDTRKRQAQFGSLDRDGTFHYDNSQPWCPGDLGWRDMRVLDATGEEFHRIYAQNMTRYRIRERAAVKSPHFSQIVAAILTPEN